MARQFVNDARVWCLNECNQPISEQDRFSRHVIPGRFCTVFFQNTQTPMKPPSNFTLFALLTKQC